MRENRLRVLVVALGLCIVLAIPTLACADSSWEEVFDNLDEWTTERGSPKTIDGCLRGSSYTQLSRPSNVTVGSWSFDAIDCWEWSPGDIRTAALKMSIMRSGNEFCGVQIEHRGSIPRQYIYTLEYAPPGGASIDLDTYQGLEGNADDLRGTIHHLKVTRTAAGDMNVYLNGTHILSGTNSEMTSSEKFQIYFAHDWAIDYIVVDDTPPGPPVELLAIGIGGAVVVVLATIVFLRRK
ncbi:MAG: hypothetical protein ACFE8Z_08920 [Candidatus Hermodarchaeota archaeon]